MQMTLLKLLEDKFPVHPSPVLFVQFFMQKTGQIGITFSNVFCMKITEYIKNSIDRSPRGYVFTYSDFVERVESKEALVKALNRLAGSGRIVKLAKGRYYKPEQSPFGELPPSQYQVVKDLLESKGRFWAISPDSAYITALVSLPRLAELFRSAGMRFAHLFNGGNTLSLL
jgi:hypothetical protein